MSAPFLPFTRPSIDEATIAAVAQVLRSGWITSGPKVLEFESVLAQRCGGRSVRVFNSGTAAIDIALKLADIGAGATVITTPLTWVATANSILAAGALPKFVDVDAKTRNIDVARIEAAITDQTRAIMPVDLAGLPVDRDALYAIANARGLRVIEDAAQSLGASWRGQAIGSTGDFVCVSFHANKNMTTGEGGALVLPDDVDPKLCERLRLQGVTRLPDGGMEVDVLGGKFNLTDIAAAIGLGQLASLDEFTARRRHLARRYFERIDPALGLELPLADFTNANWHMFQPLLPPRIDRGQFIAAMKGHGIGIGVHYPALHLFSLYRRLGYRDGDFPVAEDIGRRIVTLPLFPAMHDADVDRVCTALAAVLS